MQKKLLEYLFKKSTDFFCSIDESGKFMWLNTQAEKLFNLHSDQYKDKYLFDQFSEQNQYDFSKLLNQIKSGSSKQLTFQVHHTRFKEHFDLTWSMIWNKSDKILYCFAPKESNKSYFIASGYSQWFFNKSPFPALVYTAKDFELIDVNDRAIETYGYTKNELVQLNLSEIINKKDFKKYVLAQHVLDLDQDVIAFGIFMFKAKSGDKLKMKVEGLKFEVNGNERILISCIDITGSYHKDHLDELEREFMEKALVVDPNWDLLFEFYIKGLEQIFPDMRASILKVEDAKVWHMASTLPESFKNAINGQSISAKGGSCGTAAYFRKRIISTDIATDPLWEKYKFIALPLGLKACWSQPIFNTKKEVIATFANYYLTKRKPTKKELEIFERSASLIGIILENKDKNKELKSKINQFNYVNLATKEAIYDRDFNLNTITWGQSYYSLFGHKVTDEPKPISEWKLLVHPKDLQKTLHSLEEFLNNQNEERWQAKYRFRRVDGTFAFVEDKGYVVRNKNGVPIQMIGVLSDISQERLVDLKKEILTEVNHIFNAPSSLKITLDQITEMFLNYGGYGISEIWLLNSRKTEINLYAKAATEEGNKFYEFAKENSFRKGEGIPGLAWEKKKLIYKNHKKNDKVWIRREASIQANLKNVLAVPLLQRGEFMGVWVCAENQEDNATLDTLEKIGLDVAENLAWEIHRKRLEDDLSHIFQLAPDIICTLDFEGNFQRINTAGYELLGYSKEEIFQIPYKQLEYVANTGILNTKAQRHYKQGKTYRIENRYLTKSGKVLWLDWNCYASLEEGLIYAVARNITENKQLQNLLDDASKMALVGSWELDVINNTLYWSNITRKIHEVPKEYVPELETAISFYREDVRDKVHQAVGRAIKDGRSWDMEFPIITGKKNERWIRSIGRPEFMGDKCIRLYGSFQDIHHHKTVEVKLNTTLKEKNQILERIKDSFFAVDKNFIVKYWNKSAEKALHMPKEKILGKNIWEVFTNSIDQPSYNYYHTALRTGETVHFEDFYAPVNRWFEVSIYPSETGMSVYFKDISQRKTIEEEIRLTNERLKEIAWQQSHFVRAPLARMMAIIDVIKHGPLNSSEKEELFEDLTESADEFDSIIRDISEKTNTIDLEH